MTELKPEEALPERKLKLHQGVIYGVGCGIGGSIFVIIGEGIRIAQSGVIISLILGGLLIFFTSLNYAELSTSLPIAGGAYNFSKEGLGGFLAFIIGFFLWVANVAVCAFSAQIFALVFTEMFIRFNIEILPIYDDIIALLLVLIISIIVFKTQRITIKTLIKFTLLLSAMFVIFMVCGFFVAPFTNSSNFDPSFLFSSSNFFSILTAFSFLFIMFTSITSNLAYINADLRNPSRSIPKTYIYAISITLLIYLGITIVVLINIGGDPSTLDDSPLVLALVFENILGLFGYFFMAIAALVSTFIAVNAALGSAVSVFTALARDRYIPRIIRSKKKAEMPGLALFITVALVLVFVVFAGIGLTVEMISLIYFIGLAAVNYAAIKLRRKRKELDRPFKAPFYPVLPIFVFICFILFAIFLGIIISVPALVLGIIISLVGLSYYLLTIADRPSISLTLSGIKGFLIMIIGILIWLINNFSLTTPNLVASNRLLIVIGIFAIITIILDLLPLRELAFYLIKKVDRQKVVISIGDAHIIELGKKRTKIIHFVNILISFFQLFFGALIFAIVGLIFVNIIVINDINFGGSTISGIAITYIFNSLLIIFGITLIFSGILYWYKNRERKILGI